MFGVHPDLRPYVSTAFVLSTGVGVAGAVAMVAGWRHWPFVLFGVAALLSCAVGVVIVPRWYRQASEIVSSGVSASGRIVLEIESDSESTSLYATILSAPEPSLRVGLLMPAWPVQPLLGAPVDAAVYEDPASRRPVAFGTSRGLLWCMPRWQGRA